MFGSELNRKCFRSYNFILITLVILLLVDLFVITKLNVIRLYYHPQFPVNFYFSYGVIFIYFLLALMKFIFHLKVDKLSLFYLLFLLYCVLLGFLYGNPNFLADIKYWALGLFLLYLFYSPSIILALSNVKLWIYKFILFTEFIVEVVFYVVPAFLVFPGYGMGVPAYLLAIFLARAKYDWALLSLLMVFFQGKRGFIVASAILIIIFFLRKAKLTLWLVLPIGILAVGLVINLFLLSGSSNILNSVLNYEDSLFEIFQSFSPGRVYEVLSTIALYDDGFKFITGLGMGFEFDKIGYDGSYKGMVGYTHITPYNFFLVGGVFGFLFIFIAIYRSLANSILFAKRTGNYELIYISIVALFSSLFSFWSAVSPFFWLFISFGASRFFLSYLKSSRR